MQINSDNMDKKGIELKTKKTTGQNSRRTRAIVVEMKTYLNLEDDNEEDEDGIKQGLG